MNDPDPASRGRFPAIYAIIGIVALATIYNLDYGILHDAHWDTPWYLDQAKRFAETGYLDAYRAHAHEIARQVENRSWSTEYYYFPATYWYFARIGNIALLGAISMAFGTSADTIAIATLFYLILVACSILLTFLLAKELFRYFEPSVPERAFNRGAIISTALFAISDVYGYMGRSLVSEVPALLCSAAAALFLVKALRGRSLVFAVASGIAAFCLYVFRSNAVLAYAALIAGLAVALWIHHRRDAWWPGFILSGASAFLLYGAYAWYFHPLASPRLFLDFTNQVGSAVAGTNPPGHYLMILLASTGLLWTGALISILTAKRSAIHTFALLWLALMLAPYLALMIRMEGIQTRMLVIAMPAVFLASTLGWAALTDRDSILHIRKNVVFWLTATGTGLLLALSSSTVYDWLKELPAGWRLQYVRSVVPPYEKNTHYVSELEDIANLIYEPPDARLLVGYKAAPTSASYVGVLSMINYFRTAYPAHADVVMHPEPIKNWNPGENPVPGLERVYRLREDRIEQAFAVSDMPVWLFEVGRSDTPFEPFRERLEVDTLLKTRHYTLGKVSSLR